MDSLKPNSASTKNKLSKTLHKVIHLTTAPKCRCRTLSTNAFCLPIPQEHKPKIDPTHNSQSFNNSHNNESTMSRNRAAMEAFIAKLFATVSAFKAAYAELQMAQFPYNSEAVHSADEAVVVELKTLSELKQSFLRKQIDSSPPHVTMLLAEIQEQQSLMKMYDVTMKKLQSELETKENSICALEEALNEVISNNNAIEKRLRLSGQFSVLDGIKLCETNWNPNPNCFIMVLQYCLRCVRSFVKLMLREMESANWDLEAAANAIVPEAVFSKANHRCFAFESFVCREMFDGFDSHNFSLPNDQSIRRFVFVDRFEKLKAVNPIHYLKNNPNSAFGKFTRSKYLRLVHPKMETSFSGNLRQRKLINSGDQYPESSFFAAFAEMAKRVWLLHCLAFSFDQEVNIFQVGKNCRFSEMYMESVTDEVFASVEEDGGDGSLRVVFTVVPGFKIGKTVFQSQVYLFPVGTPVNG
ncbi:hypothetical protein ACSBR2_014441 [Camellia fascicularis]